jgi:carboxyl-terminal processing protease
MEPRGEPPDVVVCDSIAPLRSMPTVVLVNGGSASASEVVTGALQDYGKARIIGDKTFGKGCGQIAIDFPDGARLVVTTFLWKTPKGRGIQDIGLTPDELLIADPMDLAAGKDVELERALQYLSQ